MKKMIAILLAVVMVLCLAACGKSDKAPQGTQPSTQPQQTTPQGTTPQDTTPTQGSTNETQPQQTTPQGGNSQAHTHMWDYTKAQITKQPTPAEEGVQSVPCEGCSEMLTEAVAKMSNDDAFKITALGEMVSGSEKAGDNCLTAETIVRYMMASSGDGSVTKSAADFFAECGKHFALTDSLKTAIKAYSNNEFRYDAGADTFTYQAIESAAPVPLVRGFDHKGGNKYEVYYSNSSCGCWAGDCMMCLKPFHFKVEMELNRTTADLQAANKILSITKLASLPEEFAG